MFAGNFAPVGWAFCDGQLVPIAENEALFQLIGTTYGGDGQETFALPDLRSRVPLHLGTQGGANFVLGESAGVESVTLTQQQIPSHTHPLMASTSLANQETPANALTGQSEIAFYGLETPIVNMNPAVVSLYGGSQPHDNMQPFLAVHFIISLFGIFPSQT
jgi:microcystin-dependent protein